MTDPAATPVRPARRGGPASDRDDGFLSLEWVLSLPAVLLLAALLVAAGFLVRDVLVLQEAARVGARVASVTPGTVVARTAVRDAAPELADIQVAVSPAERRGGDHVVVVVTTTRRYGPFTHRLTARSTARVEPIVEGPAPATPPWTTP